MASYQARTEQLVVEELDDGVMVYDTRSHEAHWLDQTAAVVWGACAESADAVQIAQATGREVYAVELALSRLADVGLVAPSGAGVSRRTVLRTAAKVGVAGVAAAPIVSAVIPVAAAHASTVSSGGPGGGTGNAVSYQIHSGNGGPAGTQDTNNQVSYDDNGTTVTQTPTNVDPYPGAWITPISGTSWISVDASYGPGTYGPFSYSPSTPITIPSGAQNPQISIDFAVDDYVNIYVNGTQINAGNTGNFSSVSTAPSPPATAPLTTGVNTLVFEVVNSGGGPSGLDYLATISYTL